jgi:hypothetical protein
MRYWNQATPNAPLLLAGLITAAFGSKAMSADALPAEAAVVVRTDGSIAARGGLPGSRPANRHGQQVRYDFSLPRQPPRRQWLEEDTLPICQTLWEENGVRYTQTVLMTRLGSGDLPTDGKIAEDSVLMVQLTGENLTNAYAEATAGLTVEIGGQKMNLELRDGLAFVTGTHAAGLLAAIDIPASGIAVAEGPQLRFSGNMPPANSGAMTFKFPAAAPTAPKEIERLRDLDFVEELRRVKRGWANRSKPRPLPVAFAKPER